MKQSILVTGGHGFVANALVTRLVAEGFAVRCTVRDGGLDAATGVRVFRTGPLDASTDWREALSGVSSVVHCAARVHQLRDPSADPLAAYRQVNRDATARLAQHAMAAGVRRFIFLSSIKVNGERTAAGRPFLADDPVAPSDPYALSKWEAEQQLADIATRTGLGLVVIRPPLIYGPGVKANFRKLMLTLDRGVPLPLGAIHNRRSLVALPNLVDLIATALNHPAAPGRTFLVSDGESLSTTELLRRMARALGRRPRLIPVHEGLLRRAFALLGRDGLAQRLLDSLEVDMEATCSVLGWRPPISIDRALVETAQHYLAGKRQNQPAAG